MFNRKKGMFVVTAMAALAIAFVVRIGQAQKSPPAKSPAADHAQLASKIAIVGHAVGFAETRPVRELMAEAGQADTETAATRARERRVGRCLRGRALAWT